MVRICAGTFASRSCSAPTCTRFRVIQPSAVITHDVSCGGISLYASRRSRPGFRFEIAIPFSSPPLLLSAQVIRVISEEQQLYACAFSDLLPQEEALLQEGIFEYDLHHKIKTVH